MKMKKTLKKNLQKFYLADDARKQQETTQVFQFVTDGLKIKFYKENCTLLDSAEKDDVVADYILPGGLHRTAVFIGRGRCTPAFLIGKYLHQIRNGGGFYY